jgi:hypothetical protein
MPRTIPPSGAARQQQRRAPRRAAWRDGVGHQLAMVSAPTRRAAAPVFDAASDLVSDAGEVSLQLVADLTPDHTGNRRCPQLTRGAATAGGTTARRAHCLPPGCCTRGPNSSLATSLGQRERVDHASPRFRGVGEQRYRQPRQLSHQHLRPHGRRVWIRSRGPTRAELLGKYRSSCSRDSQRRARRLRRPNAPSAAGQERR